MVLDTSVLISDPDSLFAFPDADAVIPLVVVEELDQHKTRMDDVGRAAREVIRTIEELRIGQRRRHPPRRCRCPAAARCASRPTGCMLDEVAAKGLDPTKADNRILAAALGQAVARPHGRRVERRRAAHQGRPGRASRPSSTSAAGRAATTAGRPAGRTVEVSAAAHRPRSSPSPAAIDIAELAGRRRRRRRRPRRSTSSPCCRAGSQSALVRHVDGRARCRCSASREAWGLRPAVEGAAVRPRPAARPRGAGRRPRRHGRHGQDDPGPRRRARAGDGDAALYDKLSVYRPVVPVGKAELGFLPGGLDEKLDPWMTAVHRRAGRPHRDAAATPTPAPCSTR